VTIDPLALSADVDRATARLLDTAGVLTDEHVGEPSLLPGWTRGHVLTHVARNADSLVNLLSWARTGVETPQYATPTEREEGIAAGYARPAAEQVTDLREASQRFAEAAADLPAEAWHAVVGGLGHPAAHVVWRRLREVEVHHVDLGATYTPADWPESFAHRLLHEAAKDQAGDASGAGHGQRSRAGLSLTLRADSLGHPVPVGSGGPPTVSGPAWALAAWLTGRSAGVGLSVEPAGPLPAVPEWR